jgi:type IV pilus assembly protein PilB
LPETTMVHHRVIPVAYMNNRLTLAMVNPNNIIALDDIRRVIKGVMIEPVVTTDEDFRKFMTTTYAEMMKRTVTIPAEVQGMSISMVPGMPTGASTTTASAAVLSMSTDQLDMMQNELIQSLEMTSQDTNGGGETKQDLMNLSEDAPIIRLGNSILGLAIKKGASDIHIEPMEKEVIIRYRMDGVLQTVQTLPKRVQLGLISRMKIISKLDISEKRMPQDGRIAVNMEGKPIDFRVSTIPCKWGEKVCMRILDKSNTALGLDKLIAHPAVLKLLRELIHIPHGILYVTGPTGSGKTTTLYSALAEINEPGINISTAEDPIEYDLSGVNQVQAQKEIGLDFARILRAFLRQDPDVILVGETRDKETAHISVEAALTGHLVFTTLHTNSAAGAFTRLTDMGIEPFLVSSSTIGVMAQRLARRLCTKCKEQYTADEATCEFMGLPRGAKIYKARGCEHCGGKGLKGRVGIYEVMKMNAELRQMIAKGALAEEIHNKAVANGMLDLKKYSAWLLTEGHTTVEEVLQVVSVQE